MNATVAILAGGLATRLRGVADDHPKCLVQINGKPFLHYLLRHIRDCGFQDVVLLIGHLGEQVERFARDGSAYDLRIRYSSESQPLGTAGAIKNAEHLLSESFLVLNGDTFADIRLNELYEYHVQKAHAVATLALCEIADISDYGNVVITEQMEVLRFEEKQNIHVPGLVNAGVYCFSDAALGRIPPHTKYSIETQLLPNLLLSGSPLQGFRFDSGFLDIGTPDRLRIAQDHPFFAHQPEGMHP